ncbi:extracellular solute-binding protein [Cohnella nanjingensis]|uniref:Extracellular solute-binding protein n=1 Tax=Cohnella nanjingensis TaxID=1387779 RepID=A0A7X0VD63_9BACL|nr:extracellular solute-binding protein [Cohnella nanjingensis]MBB6669356.1 extracellular solute-binding protein [Cohnella nanjingensis]
MLWKEYEKMTNVHIQWEPQIPFQNLSEKLNITLAGGDYPDAFYGAGSAITPADMLKYGGEGVFLKLNDLIDKYAPNVKKLFDENPDIKKGYTMADGNIYSFPTVVEPDYMSVRMGRRIWLKKQWLDQLGIPEPKTADDFYNMLKTIKEKDPAGGGNTIAFSGFGAIDPLISYLAGAWGLYNRGLSNPNIDIDPKTNDIRFIPTAPEYKEILQYINKLYNEKLLWSNLFDGDFAKLIAEGSKGNMFAVFSQDPKKVFNLDGYIGVPAIKGTSGDPLYVSVGSPILWSGAFILTDKAKNPETLVRWIDHLYSDEGRKCFSWASKARPMKRNRTERSIISTASKIRRMA